MSEIETADDGGENAGSVGAFAGEICEVWSDEADGDFDGRVVNFGFEVVDQPGDDETDHDAAGDQVEKPFDADGKRRNFTRDDKSDGKFESEQAAGVVDEAFSFDDVGDALGDAEAPGDCGGGDRVGGADDGAENEAEAEVEAGKNPVGDGGDAANGEDDETESEHGDADEVVAEVAPGGGESRGEEQRGKDYEENHVGIQGDVRYAGKEAEDQAADDENDGVGRLETFCESGQACDEEQEEEKNQFDAVDAGCLHGFGGLKITARRRGDKETERKAHDEDGGVVATGCEARGARIISWGILVCGRGRAR